jgi:hypothetical protein
MNMTSTGFSPNPNDASFSIYPPESTDTSQLLPNVLNDIYLFMDQTKTNLATKMPVLNIGGKANLGYVDSLFQNLSTFTHSRIRDKIFEKEIEINKALEQISHTIDEIKQRASKDFAEFRTTIQELKTQIEQEKFPLPTSPLNDIEKLRSLSINPKSKSKPSSSDLPKRRSSSLKTRQNNYVFGPSFIIQQYNIPPLSQTSNLRLQNDEYKN